MQYTKQNGMNQILKQKFQNHLNKMSLRKNSEINSIQGNEGTKIKQYFHPHNTLNGINYSLAQFTLGVREKNQNFIK